MTTLVESLAKLAFAKPKVELPDLPEELWQDIFRYACNISESNFDYSPKLLSFPTALPRKVICKKLIVQRRLILVCKAWHRIALPYLYEEIVLTNNLELPRFMQTLAKNSMGHYTRRLNFYLNEPAVDEEVFFAILDHLPNLHIVIIDSSASRRCLPISISKRILALPSLQVLNDPNSHRILGRASTPKSLTLRAMTFPILPGEVEAGTDHCLLSAVPNFSQLCFADEIYSYYELSQMRRHLQSVTSIVLSRNCGFACGVLDCISVDLFPNLRYLGIQATSRHWLCRSRGPTVFSRVSIPSNVHTLGFTFLKPKAKTAMYRRLCERLSLIQGDGLQVIRFGAHTALDLQTRPFAAALVEATLRAKGWRMEVGDMYV